MKNTYLEKIIFETQNKVLVLEHSDVKLGIKLKDIIDSHDTKNELKDKERLKREYQRAITLLSRKTQKLEYCIDFASKENNEKVL